jgi:uncharacterized membrane protein
MSQYEEFRRRLPKVNPVVLGHPLHAIATDLPAALIPTGFFLSVAGVISREPALQKAGFVTTVTGVGSAIPTAVTGLADYSQMEVKDPAWKTGLVHGLLNATALGFGIASLAGRSLKRPLTSRGLWFGGIATGILFASAWLGGDLVYHRGWRVKPMEREEMETNRVPSTVHDEDFIPALRRPESTRIDSIPVPQTLQ